MRTPVELMALHQEWAKMGDRAAQVAFQKQDWVLALQNWDGVARDEFTRALLAWRSGVTSPAPMLEAAIQASESATSLIRSTELGPLRHVFYPVPGGYSAILLDRLDSPALDELRGRAGWPPPRGVSHDLPLEAWLARSLTTGETSGVDGALEAIGRRKRTSLLAESFRTYLDLASAQASRSPGVVDRTRQAVSLFAKRRRDPYFAGGLDNSGGDLNNDVVIDFHLAAIWHVRGWSVTELTGAERVHVMFGQDS